MNKREAQRQAHQENTLMALGFTRDEADKLRRISMALQRWHERECGTDNGCIERNETTGKTYWLNSMTMRRYPIRDMETGAKNRLNAIIRARNKREFHAIVKTDVSAYIQGDPRGAALYIIRPGDVPEGADVGAYYSRGVVVY